MRRTILYLLFAAGLVAMSGCAAKRLMERGEAAMLAGEPVRAREYYRQALSKDAALAKKPKFVARLNHIGSRAAYAEGRTLGEKGRWEEALSKFEESVRLEGTFAPAGEGVAEARREASRARHAKALKFADEGKLNEALRELKRALELDPANADAKESLESVTEQSRLRSGRGHDTYRQAKALQAESRWGRAAEAYQAAVALAPNHIPSRLGLAKANQAMKRARADLGEGRRLLGQRRLAGAAAALERSLKTWPFLTEASDALGQARAQLARAEGFFTNARRHEAQADWPASAAAVWAALAVYPYHRGANELFQRVRHQAAAAHTGAGSKLLSAGRTDDAEAQLLLAVRYVPDDARARALLAGICRGRARWAEGAERWGAALMWTMDAADWAKAPEDAEAIGRARERIGARIAFGVDVSVSAAGSAPRAGAEGLKAALLARLGRRRPAFVSVAAGASGPRAGAFAADVRLGELSVRQQRVRSESRTHDYEIQRDVPNPEIPKLEALIRSAQRELAQTRREYARRCPYCGGTGRRGRGDRDGRHRSPVCSHCGGTGRASRISEHDVRRKESELRDLRRRLLFAPASVSRSFPAAWAYTVHHYEKTGALAADLRLTSPAGAAVEQAAIRRSSCAKDATIDGANPGVGLRPDPLVLPSDAAVRESLIDAAASEAAMKILTACVAAEARRARSLAADLDKRGKDVDAFEARVDLMHLLRPFSGKDAGALQARLRAGPKPKP